MESLGDPIPKNPPPLVPELPPYPPIRLMYRFLKNNGNAMKMPSAATNPYGNGRTICNPILIARDAPRKSR
jgi:hypothetical protein